MLESPATDPGRAAEDMREFRKVLALACNDPGHFVGFKGERSLGAWQVDALLAGPLAQLQADLIAARKERDEATRLLRVLNEETVLAGYPCGDRDRTLANLRALRSDLIALAKMYGEACRDLVYARSGEDDLFWQKEEAVVALSRKLVAAEEEAAQLRARLHEAEKGEARAGSEYADAMDARMADALLIENLRIAFLVLAESGHGGGMAEVRKWFAAGATGPIPWPGGKLFEVWAAEHDIHDCNGAMGFRRGDRGRAA